MLKLTGGEGDDIKPSAMARGGGYATFLQGRGICGHAPEAGLGRSRCQCLNCRNFLDPFHWIICLELGLLSGALVFRSDKVIGERRRGGLRLT